MENSPIPETNRYSQNPVSPVQPAPGKPNFLKRLADKLPGWMFPKPNPNSSRTWAVVGLVLAAFSLLLALVPCVGGNAWFFGVPALYVCLLAIRAGAPAGQNNGTLTTVGVVLAVLAIVIALFQIAVFTEAAKSVDNDFREFERSFGSGDFSF